MQDIAKEIIILRGKREWTQQQLADAIGTTQRTVAAWESGTSIPRKAMQARIAMAFGLPEDYFLKNGLVEEEKPPRRAKESRNDEEVAKLVRQLGEALGEGGLSADTRKSCLDLYHRLLTETGLDGSEREK